MPEEARPYSTNGCCADRKSRDYCLSVGRDVRHYNDICTETTCMELPTGETCGSCVHVRRCTTMFGADPSDTSCGFYPRRFRKSPAVEANNGPASVDPAVETAVDPAVDRSPPSEQ
jgi:hypothetical protein